MILLTLYPLLAHSYHMISPILSLTYPFLYNFFLIIILARLEQLRMMQLVVFFMLHPPQMMFSCPPPSIFSAFLVIADPPLS